VANFTDTRSKPGIFVLQFPSVVGIKRRARLIQQAHIFVLPTSSRVEQIS
jgi:hypothetical protein